MSDRFDREWERRQAKAGKIVAASVGAAIVLFLLCLGGCTGCASRPEFISHDVPNLLVVAPGLARGGEPISSNGWAWLVASGYTNEVKLDTMEEGKPGPATTMSLVYAPINLQQQLDLWGSRPIDDDFVQSVVTCMSEPGTFVHCKHGKDRTGLMVACYRVLAQGWTPDRAEKEMLACGFDKRLDGLWDYWKGFKNRHSPNRAVPKAPRRYGMTCDADPNGLQLALSVFHSNKSAVPVWVDEYRAGDGRTFTPWTPFRTNPYAVGTNWYWTNTPTLGGTNKIVELRRKWDWKRR